MARLFTPFFASIIVIGAALSCSATSGDSGPPATLRQALTSCYSDFDCNFGPNFEDGEHCGMDGVCHTIAEDPSCGLWQGTYPNCTWSHGDCRLAHCVYPSECRLNIDSNCHLPGETGPGFNPCSPYVYSNPCATECDDDDDCEPNWICEESVSGNVCG